MIYQHHIKDSELPALYSCGYDRDLKPGAKYGPVIRDFYIVECCTAGYGSVIINGQEFAVKKGDCYFLLPGDTILHTASDKFPREGAWCAFDGINIGIALKRAGISSESPFAPPEVFESIYENVERLIETTEDRGGGAEYRRAAYIYAILGELLDKSASYDKNIWVQKAIGIMETNYFDKGLNASSIADAVGLERSYFSVLFKDKVGMSPYSYLTSLRIHKACSLIKSESLGVSDIAEMTGFDQMNFSKIFKREMGVTPTEYRMSPGGKNKKM